MLSDCPSIYAIVYLSKKVQWRMVYCFVFAPKESVHNLQKRHSKRFRYTSQKPLKPFGYTFCGISPRTLGTQWENSNGPKWSEGIKRRLRFGGSARGSGVYETAFKIRKSTNAQRYLSQTRGVLRKESSRIQH